MAVCSYCGQNTHLYICPYCKREFCLEHAHPEKHNCTHSKVTNVERLRATTRPVYSEWKKPSHTKRNIVLVAGLLLAFAGAIAFIAMPSILSTINIQSILGFDKPPVITIISPSYNEYLNTSYVTVSASYSDDKGINQSSIILKIDNQTTNPNVLTERDLMCSVTLLDGKHVVLLSLSDSVGNVVSNELTFFVDTKPPSVMSINPNNRSQITDTSLVLVTAMISDSSTVKCEYVKIDGRTIEYTFHASVDVNTSLNRYDISSFCAFEDGMHTVELSVNDSANNRAYRSWSFDVVYHLQLAIRLSQSAIKNVLNELNTARTIVGLNNVTLITKSVAADYRSKYMLNNSYFNHYDLNGYNPGYYYTKFGGEFAIEENIGYYYISMWQDDKLPEYAENSVHEMIYNDASSNWGHRDSLLDPSNNFVDIGVAYGDNSMYLTIHMVKIWVDWMKTPRLELGKFSCSGKLTLTNSKITGVLIYYSNPFEHLQKSNSYSIGTPIIGVVPEPYYYPTLITERPTTWIVNGQSFNLAFNFNAQNGRGIYTVVVLGEDSFNHPFDGLRYYGGFPVLEYSVLID
jgi:uncharacterized protein YkwD